MTAEDAEGRRGLNRCLACGAPLVDGGLYCPPSAVELGPWERTGSRFQGCEPLALETVYRARPEHMKHRMDLHYPHGALERNRDVARFHAAYGDDCNYSVHGPLPLVEEIRRNDRFRKGAGV